jgi:predicted membrane protein
MNNSFGSVIIGFLAIGFGVFYLLKTFGLVPSINLFDYWPSVLILFSLYKMIFPGSPHTYFWAPFVGIAGVLLLLKSLHLISFSIVSLWPIIPIVFGLRILFRPFLKSNTKTCTKTIIHHKHGSNWKNDSFVNDNNLSISLLLSGGKYVCTGKNFTGGNISLTLAGCEIDLTKVETSHDEIFIDVNLMLGGIEMWIPDNWSVSFDGTPVLGSFDNKTNPLNPTKRLIIRGSLTLAGLEVRN